MKGKQITVHNISLTMTLKGNMEGDTDKGKMKTNTSKGNIHGTQINFYGKMFNLMHCEELHAVIH